MNEDQLAKRIDELNKEELDSSLEAMKADSVGEEKGGETAPPVPGPVDVYDINRKAQIEESRTPRPKGAPSIVMKAAQDIIKDRIVCAYRKAKNDSSFLEGQGEPERAKLVRDQYMQETFLPAVEALVMFSSPDEVLNAKGALALMDNYVLNKTGGAGYTSAYLKSAYDKIMGNSRNLSDPTVKVAVYKIVNAADSGNNRVALGLAQQIKTKIDNGEQISSDEDYELISRVVSAF